MPPPLPEPASRFSPDGLWWFDGSAWRPTTSPDGHWRWTGQAWVPARRASLPRWVKVCRVVWLVLLGAWLLFLTLAARGTSTVPGWAVLPTIALGAVAVLSTLVWGAVLGKLRSWRTVATSAPAGAGVLALWYVVAMVSSNDPTADNAAGVGVVMLGIPALVLVALLLVVGGAVGAAFRR